MTATTAPYAWDEENVRYVVDLSQLPPGEWEMVTPTMAVEALTRQRKQRKLRLKRAEAIAHDIRTGKWRITGESVQQGEDGLWDNGQHRFEAVRQAGIAVPMMVVRGIDQDARLVLDSGAARQFRDTLHMREIANSDTVAAITRRMWMWDEQRRYIARGGGHVQPTNSDLDGYLAEHIDEIEPGARLKNDAARCWLTPAVLGTVFILLRRIDKGDCMAFLEGLITGADLAWTDPRRVLRDKLAALHRAGRLVPDEARAWVFLAWNMWRDGREVSKLQPPRGGTARQPFTDKNYPLPH